MTIYSTGAIFNHDPTFSVLSPQPKVPLYMRRRGIIAAVQATITDRYHKIKRKSGQGPDRGRLCGIHKRDDPPLSQITMYLRLALIFVFHILSASAQCQWATIANLNAGCLTLGYFHLTSCRFISYGLENAHTFHFNGGVRFHKLCSYSDHGDQYFNCIRRS